MKKLLGCALALVMLTACGGSGEPESKVCTMTLSGMDLQATFTGNDKALDKVEMELVVPFSLAGLTDEQAKSITDEMLDTVGQSYLTSMGIKDGEGVEATFTAQDSAMLMKMNFDLSKGDTTALTQFGLSADQSLSDAVSDWENGGGSCK